MICFRTGKFGYESAGVARKVARKSPERKRLTVYKCPHCLEWHLTSTERKRNK